MNALVQEYNEWLFLNKIEPRCATEILILDDFEGGLTPAQRAWLDDFVERWDAQQDVIDARAQVRR